MSPVDSQVCASAEAASIAKQEDCSAPVLLWIAQSAQHVVLGPVLLSVRELLEERGRHGGDNIARRDGVDPDAVLAPFAGQISGKLDDASLGGIIGPASCQHSLACNRAGQEKENPRANQPLVRNRAAHASNQHQTARLVKPSHLSGDSLRRHEHSRDVDGKHLVRILHGVVQGRSLLLDASTSYQAVQTAILIGNLLDGRVQADVVSHVDSVICYTGTQLVLCAIRHALEVWVRLGLAVDGVDWRAWPVS